MIATKAYGKPVSELSETEKQTVSALAGLAGGLIGDSIADAVAGAQTGETVVENNAIIDIVENKLSGIRFQGMCMISLVVCRPSLLAAL
ncbi:VENN motif pre-toxin domain-containing protein [Serratia plymuthica]|nr:VENN motif pre-toxin domain-containing protein [Serratia plymuthica]QUY47611.1 VENN motif pre-toxin domain-containing protein [Serratia plymuthica]